jgi:threonine dehydrogenase-like Zn-dependent dehydrogenase
MRRALVAEGPGGAYNVGIKHKPRLQRGDGEVLVRPVYVGLCGTDLELVSGDADPSFVKYPVTLGKNLHSRR